MPKSPLETIELPRTVLFVPAFTLTPSALLNAMRLPSPAAVPPMRLLLAVLENATHVGIVRRDDRAGRVGANIIAKDGIVGCGRPIKFHTIAGVAGDDIPRAGRRTTDDVVVRAGVEAHAVGAVADARGAVHSETNDVAENCVVGRGRAARCSRRGDCSRKSRCARRAPRAADSAIGRAVNQNAILRVALIGIVQAETNHAAFDDAIGHRNFDAVISKTNNIQPANGRPGPLHAETIDHGAYWRR